MQIGKGGKKKKEKKKGNETKTREGEKKEGKKKGRGIRSTIFIFMRLLATVYRKKGGGSLQHYLVPINFQSQLKRGR